MNEEPQYILRLTRLQPPNAPRDMLQSGHDTDQGTLMSNDEPIFVTRTRGDVAALAAPYHSTVIKLREAKEVASHFGAKLSFHDHHLIMVDNSKKPFEIVLPHFLPGYLDRQHALEAIGMRLLHPELRHINDTTDFKVREEGLWWALGAIMPREAFEKAAKNYSGSSVLMADYFNVSEKTLYARARSLSLEQLIATPKAPKIKV